MKPILLAGHLEIAPWSLTHLQIPTPISIGDIIRIFYATRDGQNRSHMSFLDVSKEDPTKVVYRHEEPIVSLGPVGSFDEFGVMPSSAVKVGNEIWIYYIGWSRDFKLPYRLAIGLVKGNLAGNEFKKYSVGPILDRSPGVPYYATTPFVQQSTKGFEMFLAIGTGWIEMNGLVEPRYELATSTSKNGVEWETPRRLFLDDSDGEVCAVRPWIFIENGKIKLLFSKRGINDYRGGINSYRSYESILKFEDNQYSVHGLKEIAIEKYEGLNKDMTAYLATVTSGNNQYFFFNGSGFGKSGILFCSDTTTTL